MQSGAGRTASVAMRDAFSQRSACGPPPSRGARTGCRALGSSAVNLTTGARCGIHRDGQPGPIPPTQWRWTSAEGQPQTRAGHHRPGITRYVTKTAPTAETPLVALRVTSGRNRLPPAADDNPFAGLQDQCCRSVDEAHAAGDIS